TGNLLSNTLGGNSGNNVLDGGKGADVFAGHAGDDTFILDDAAEDNAGSVQEAVGEGTDTVKTALAAIDTAIDNVENYIFTGTTHWDFAGNDLDNAITGGAANDTLHGGKGNDRLDGGLGDDDLQGNEGDDTYVISSAKDKVTELFGEGDHDKVLSSLSTNLATDAGFAGQEIEDLTLTSTAA